MEISKLDLIKKIMEVQGDSVDLDSLVYKMKEDFAKDSNFEELEKMDEIDIEPEPITTSSNSFGEVCSPTKDLPAEQDNTSDLYQQHNGYLKA